MIYVLLLVRAVSHGDGSYQRFLAWSGKPVVLLLNLVTLGFVLFHAITWFNLAPQAMVVHALGKRVPGRWLTAANYLAWAFASALVVWLVLGG